MQLGKTVVLAINIYFQAYLITSLVPYEDGSLINKTLPKELILRFVIYHNTLTKLISHFDQAHYEILRSINKN